MLALRSLLILVRICKVLMSSIKTIQLKQISIELNEKRPERQLFRFIEQWERKSEQLRYFIEVQIGSPGQKQMLMIDTGSTYSWVLSPNSTNCYAQANIFNSSMSSTFRQLNEHKQIRYLYSSVSGYFGSDIIHFGQTQSKMKLLVANECKGTFKNVLISGIMGLDNQINIQNMLDQAFIDGSLVSSMFAFTFGNRILRQASFMHYNITQADYPDALFIRSYRTQSWSIPLNKIKIKDNEYYVEQAIIDTGATLTMLPAFTFNQVFDTFFSSTCMIRDYKNIYTCQCSQLSAYPTIRLQINETLHYNISSQMYLSRISQSQCILQIVGSDKETILGMNILQNFNIIFDKKKNRIGFQNAPKRIQPYIPSGIILNSFSFIIVAIVVIYACMFKIFINKQGKLQMSRQLFQLSQSETIYNQKRILNDRQIKLNNITK